LTSHGTIFGAAGPELPKHLLGKIMVRMAPLNQRHHPFSPLEVSATLVLMTRRRSRKFSALFLAFALLLGMQAPASAAFSRNADPSTASVKGTVFALAEVDGRIFIGGTFTEVGGLPRHNVAALLPDGSVDPNFVADTNGRVDSLAASEDGQLLFAGGEFTTVNGESRNYLAAVSPIDGAVASWRVETDERVRALAVAGPRLYVGGTFRQIGDENIRRLAAVEIATEKVIRSFNPWPNWTVKSIAVSPDGTKVYAVGGFNRISNVDRPGAAEILAATGRATDFSPRKGGLVITAALSPDGSRFFYATPDNILYAYDPAVSSDPVYTIKTGGDTQAIAVTDNHVYIGGHFSRINTFKTRRVHMASFEIDGNAVTDWDPRVGGRMGVWAALVTDDALYIGGDFPQVGKIKASGIARFLGTP
jgi:DNA-binding beta-propeller fold protein YncE